MSVPESTEGQLHKLFGFALTLGASLGTFGFFALQGILLARMLGLEDRGAFAAIVLFPQALLYLGMLGAPELFAGYAAANMPNAPLRRSAALYGLFAGCLTALLCIVFDYLLIGEEFRSVLPLAFLCAFTMPLQQIRLSVQAVDHGQRQLGRYNKVRLAAAAIFPLLLVMAIVGDFHDLQTACVLFVVAQVLGLGLTQVGMTESWFGLTAVPVRQALHDARGLMGAWMATELLERLDLVLMAILIANKAILGSYSTAVPIAAMMIIVPNAVGLYVFNRGARDDEHLSTNDAWRFLTVGVAIQVLTGAALALTLPWVVPLFYGAEFDATVTYAWLLIPAGALRGLLQACDSYLRARKKPGPGITARVAAIPFLLIISLWGEPWLGPAAIPIGLCIAQLVCFLIVAAAVVRDTYSPSIS